MSSMVTQNKKKLRILFNELQQGGVITASMLKNLGISKDLRKYYIESGWLEPLGRGAYKKPGDNVEWQGALNAIHLMTDTNVHVGGLSALSVHGQNHYVRLNEGKLFLFSSLKNRLPKWFLDYNWKVEVINKASSLISNDTGIKEMDIKQKMVRVSTPERAIIECLYLSPVLIDMVECYQLFEGLVNLKPKLVSELLLNCNSVKVKRLFLYMAEKANHQWLQFVKTEEIDIGSGKRMLIKNGTYISKYSISIPKELADL